MNSLACASCPVRDSAACAVLSEAERDALAAAGRTRVLKRGEMLFAAGDDEAACATLISGALKVSAIDREGTEQILSLVHPSGFIGELFTPFAHHDVVALTSVSSGRSKTTPRSLAPCCGVVRKTCWPPAIFWK